MSKTMMMMMMMMMMMEKKQDQQEEKMMMSNSVRTHNIRSEDFSSSRRADPVERR